MSLAVAEGWKLNNYNFQTKGISTTEIESK